MNVYDQMWEERGRVFFTLYKQQLAKGIDDRELWSRVIFYLPGIIRPEMPLCGKIRRFFSQF